CRASSAAMCGIIWFVQAVHYPLFARVQGQEQEFALENQRRTQGVVIPLMLAEGLAAAVIAWAPPAGVPRPVAVAGVVALAVLWLSTALVRSNWLRTALWTLRAVLAAWMLRVAA
ncbi:MAG: hypothetical protein ACKO6E_09860, partial [Planctomycetota bacterium]